MRQIDFKLKKLKQRDFPRYLSFSLPRVEVGSLDALWLRVKETVAGAGAKSCLLAGSYAYTRFKEKTHDLDIQSFALVRECCWEGIRELSEMIKKSKPDYLIAVGGGKCLDTAKLLKEKLGLPLVLVPSSAATCSAFSPVSVVYTPEHEFKEVASLNATANLVILDMDLIMTSPPRMLAAGIADTLAKWLEAKAVLCASSAQDEGMVGIEVDSETNVQAAFEVAREAYRNVITYGEQAMKDHQFGNKTKEWQETVWASIISNGAASFLGGDDYPAALAHSFANGLTVLPRARDLLHGEAVALGLLIQTELLQKYHGAPLVLKNELFSFYKKLGLPCSLKETAVGGMDGDEEKALSDKVFVLNESIFALPFKVSRQDFTEVLKTIY